MRKNIGKADKYTRLAIGATIIAIGAHLNSVLGVIGIIPIITAEIGICPIYLALGLNTAPKENIHSKSKT